MASEFSVADSPGRPLWWKPGWLLTGNDLTRRLMRKRLWAVLGPIPSRRIGRMQRNSRSQEQAPPGGPCPAACQDSTPWAEQCEEGVAP